MSIDRTVIMEEDHPMVELLEDLEYSLEKGIYGCGSPEHLMRARLLALTIDGHEKMPANWRFIHVVEAYIVFWEDQFSPFPKSKILLLPPRELMQYALDGTFRWKDHSGNPGHSTWEPVE